jgi:hypothetical protein
MRVGMVYVKELLPIMHMSMVLLLDDLLQTIGKGEAIN